MLFYLILKNSKNGVLYGLNKEHVNFIAHHETKFSHGVAQAGSGHCQVAVRVQQPRQTPAGSRAGAPRRLVQLTAGGCPCHLVQVPPSVCKLIFRFSEGKK